MRTRRAGEDHVGSAGAPSSEHPDGAPPSPAGDAASGASAGPNLEQVIHQPVRLRIMAALVALGDDESIEFTAQKEALGLSDGNLSSHLSTLESAGYVELQKGFFGKRPRTSVRATSEGRRAFARHIDALEQIIRSAGR